MSVKVRNYTEEFKKQIVMLVKSGKSSNSVAKEYGISKSSVTKWVRDFNNSGSFKAKDNRTPEENDLIELRKRIKELEMEADILKQAALIMIRKFKIILANRHKYSISAMCRRLRVPRSLVYYKKKMRKTDSELENTVIEIFKKSHNNYGSRKIKVELAKRNIIASKRRIRRVMDKYGLVSNYTIKQFKVHKNSCNEEKIENKVDRKFNDRERLEVVISDLTYVRVRDKWCYICILIDLFNREIIRYSAGAHKDAQLVYDAFLSSRVNLSKVKIFHTDRGNEFKNKIIDEFIDTFEIDRSLSHKGCPYDNAVAEATYKIFKTEFVMNKAFDSLEQLKLELADYIHWFNNQHIHGSLGYLSPIQFKSLRLAK
ncbi:MAG: IS3 family transposase [Ruminococcus flavefaciens]|nr:IS3 family transposase [Ruminococcus flavefaciens]